jgi:hypothetical protein
MAPASISSARLSAGSNASHPVTPSYTQLFAYTPRSGESGNVHSPALKQYPWSMKVAVYPRLLGVVRQKIACRPSLLHVHLSSTSTRAKSARLRSLRAARSASVRLEFGDVRRTVRSPHQLGLRSSACISAVQHLRKLVLDANIFLRAELSVDLQKR